MGRDDGKDLYKGVQSYLYAHLILYHIVISNAVDKESLEYHFSPLKQTLEDNNLMNKAGYIYNRILTFGSTVNEPTFSSISTAYL